MDPASPLVPERVTYFDIWHKLTLSAIHWGSRLTSIIYDLYALGHSTLALGTLFFLTFRLEFLMPTPCFCEN